MKQVTIENVKKRIARIENGESVMRPSGMGLSMQHEFELACLRQLVAVTEQLHAVVAEMAKLKTAHPQPFGPEMMRALEAYEWRQDDVPETGMIDAFFILRDSIRVETPATDAAIAALRAEGVEMAIKDALSVDTVASTGAVKFVLQDFANKLRQSVQVKGVQS